MKFSTVLSTILLTEVALAAPSLGADKRHRSREARKLARAEGKTLKTGPRIAADTASGIKNGEFVEYSSNWAGGVISTTGVTSVTGTATVPKVASGDGAAWVGIDGDSCETAILQTGFQWIDGEYAAWYEWYPADSVNFDITIAEGDSIKMTVTATSKSAGEAIIENVTTGVTVSKTFSGESDALCEFDAEWIVEDFEECEGNSCSLVPFGDFGTVEFTAASATIGGVVTTPAKATVIDIEQNSVLTDCSVSSSGVTCTYV